MPRIRTVKPAFFRHDLLQELEAKHPTGRPMLVFLGLWTICDKAGRFEWRPNHLKLDILPFLTFDLEDTLLLLAKAGLIKAYEQDGRRYGLVDTLPLHQRFSGSEAKNNPIYPTPTAFVDPQTFRSKGSAKEAPKKRSGSDPETQTQKQFSKEALRNAVKERSTEYGIEEKERSSTSSDPDGSEIKEEPELTSPDQPAVPTDWVAQFGSDWEEIVKGVPDYGRIGKTAKAAVERFGFDRTRIAWRRFLADPKARQYRFTSFSQDVGDYEPKFVNGADDTAVMRALGITQ